MAEQKANVEWKKLRQEDKELNINLPLGIEFHQWKQDQERLKKADIRIDYQKILLQLDNLSADVKVKDILLSQKIQREEDKMKNDIKHILKRFWALQKEKKTVADGDLFELHMVNPRCLPIINEIMDEPKDVPNCTITVVPAIPLAIAANPIPVKSEEWQGEWSE